MLKLSQEMQGKAKAFLRAKARPLEQARHAFHFETACAAEVLEQLGAYQNLDGGFGHALEPDLRMPDSSAVATSVGLQILREVGASSEEEIVQRAVSYLLDTYDESARVWAIIPPEANDHPHAGWWTYTDSNAGDWGGYLANPRAEIVGYLWQYGSLVPDGMAAELTAAVLADLETRSDEIEMHEALCVVRLAETRELPSADRTRLLHLLRPVLRRLVVTSPDGWARYGLQPVDVVGTPESPLASGMGEALARNLDYVIAAQTPDGSWRPTWSWGDAYPEDWALAEVEASGIVTLRALLTLRAHGRLA